MGVSFEESLGIEVDSAAAAATGVSFCEGVRAVDHRFVALVLPPSKVALRDAMLDVTPDLEVGTAGCIDARWVPKNEWELDPFELELEPALRGTSVDVGAFAVLEFGNTLDRLGRDALEGEEPFEEVDNEARGEESVDDAVLVSRAPLKVDCCGEFDLAFPDVTFGSLGVGVVVLEEEGGAAEVILADLAAAAILGFFLMESLTILIALIHSSI
jgi:hypothetical protein